MGADMNRFLVYSAVFFSGIVYADEVPVPSSAFHIDSIQAVVFGQHDPQIITHSDVSRLSLSGESRTLDDLVFESRVISDAEKYKIVPDEEAVDKYLSQIQKQNNMTLDDLKQVFSSAGMSYEEGREQLKKMQTVQQMIDFKVRTQVIVPKKAVEQYYEEHPIVKEGHITVQRGFMPYADGKLTEQRKALAYMAKSGKELKGMQWGLPFELHESEVAEDKAFMFALKAGEISDAKDVGIGFEVFRAIDVFPREVPSLEQRYKEIADELRRPIFENLLEKYKKSLMESASVLYLQPINPLAPQAVP